MTSRIVSTGSYLPLNKMSNDDLADLVDTSDEWIQARTGILYRHIATEETTVSMAVSAGKKAMEHGSVSAEDIELIIVATISPDSFMPSTACEVQEALGAKNAVAFDINAACSGFIYALHTAHAYIQSGLYKTALIIGAETLSKMVDWKDRSTCILFGDGAGACILKEDRVGILSLMQKSDGSKSQVLYCKNRETHNPYIKGNRNPQYMVMNGQEVYKFALKKVPESIKEVVEKAQVELDTIKYFILHQANKRILFSVAKRLSLPIEKFPMNLDQCGNTSAASIPILLDEMNQKGMLKQGDKVVLSGFGGGLTWAGTLLEW